MLFRGKKVAVVGGGDTAAGDALLLSELCETVTLIHRRDSLRATKIYRDALEKKQNVDLVFNSRVTAIRGNAKAEEIEVASVDGTAVRSLALDGIFISIGREPSTALFRDQIELDASGYVVADETTKTSLPGVFAVGDVRTKPVRQVVTATADGATASHFVEEYFARYID
jgi:thioredoxin reductase (NADPH)